MTDPYLCQSYYDEENVLHDCSCGKCGTPGERLKSRLHNEEAMLEVAKAATEDQRKAVTHHSEVEGLVGDKVTALIMQAIAPYHTPYTHLGSKSIETVKREIMALITTHSAKVREEERERIALLVDSLSLSTGAPERAMEYKAAWQFGNDVLENVKRKLLKAIRPQTDVTKN